MGRRQGRHLQAGTLWSGGRTTAAGLGVALLLLAGCGSGDGSAVTLASDTAPGAASPGAATPAAATGATAPQLATIHGVVTRAGQPAADARLTLTGGDGSDRVVTADDKGAYRFTAVPAGHYELIAYGESGVTCDAGNCVSASWAEKVELDAPAGETVRIDVDGD